MGYGGYSHEAHAAITRARVNVPVREVFKQTLCHPLMQPRGVRLRESRDSVEHPSSLGVVFALDVTGSMGEIPDLMARRELPTFVKTLLDQGIAHPQVLFLAVGDAASDAAPLQVGQFESTAELMDQWLTWCFLEGGGGGQGSESYELALHFAARHVEMDCFAKRGRRGYLFMTGDEKPYPALARSVAKDVIGDELDEDLPLAAIVDEVGRSFEPFFLIPDVERRAACERAWRDVLGDHVICMETPDLTCEVAAGAIALAEGIAKDLDALVAGLRARGVARDRAGSVARSLMSFAASLGKDGAPAPVVAEEPLPWHDDESGHRRPTA